MVRTENTLTDLGHILSSLGHYHSSAMKTEPPALPDLPVSQMDRNALDTLSYIFCSNVVFTDFNALWLYFTATRPTPGRIGEFWDEVEDLGYYGA